MIDVPKQSFPSPRPREVTLTEQSSTVNNALTALDIVFEHGPINATQLGRMMAIDRTVARRLLSTLHGRGFVLRTDTGYVLGPALVTLSAGVAPALRGIVQPTMRGVAENSGETVLCHFRQGENAIVLAQVVGNRHPVRVEEEVGRHYPLHGGAGGLALLAAMSSEESAKVLKSVPDRGAIEQSLVEARRQGYAVSHGKRRAGVHGIAAAVLSASGAPVCSLSIVVPDQRADTVPDLVPSLLAAASRLGRLLAADEGDKTVVG